MNLIFLDTETTDLGENARLVQLAYKDSVTGEVVREYFKPPVPVAFGAMAVHHITEKMLVDKPLFVGSLSQEKLMELAKDHILVAHNAAFDLQVLKNEGVVFGQFVDTVRLARHLVNSEEYKLQYLRYFLNLDAEGMPHDALGDVMVLEALFGHLFDLVQNKFQLANPAEVLAKILELNQTPVLLEKFWFGKYSGKMFSEVLVSDRGYMDWLLASESQKKESERNQEMIYTLKYYLKVS